jgi:glycerol-3-phosphate dehydrogenase (NAD(P)+)
MEQKVPMDFVIVGAGRWGSALQSIALENAHTVSTLDRDASDHDWKKAIKPHSIVVLATPFAVQRSLLSRLARYQFKGLVNASKGIDHKKLLTFSSLAKPLIDCPLATLSGPTFAQEVQEKKPTAAVVAGKNKNFVRRLCLALSTPRFRLYESDDPVGVEVCGALKNVLAIACGISDGLHWGYNARAALLARGLREMEVLVTALGGKRSTVTGLAGVGDLWLTATGDLSRNRQLGLRMARGETPDQITESLAGPAEGFYTVKQVKQLARKFQLDLPISQEVYALCFLKQRPQNALERLMTRDLKPEAATFQKHR